MSLLVEFIAPPRARGEFSFQRSRNATPRDLLKSHPPAPLNDCLVRFRGRDATCDKAGREKPVDLMARRRCLRHCNGTLPRKWTRKTKKVDGAPLPYMSPINSDKGCAASGRQLVKQTSFRWNLVLVFGETDKSVFGGSDKPVFG
jgi:hypothetical protein